MALWKTVLICVIVVILLIMIYNVFFNKEYELLNRIEPSHPGIRIDNARLPENNSSNYSFSIWFFIDNWNHNFGTTKSLIQFASNQVNPSPQHSSSSHLNSDNNVFMAAFSPFENDLLIGIKTFSPEQNITAPDGVPNFEDKFKYQTFSINNIDIQRWVCLICSVQGRSLDVYLQGKLVRSFILPSLAVSPGSSNIFLGGPSNITYKGHLARLEYYPHSLNPQEAYNIYRNGLGSNMFLNFLNRYSVKIQFMEYDNALGQPLII